MTSERTAYIHIWLPGESAPVVCGRLHEGEASRLDWVYARSYLERSDAIALDLDELPLERGRVAPPLGDLHGVIRDASPDAWGRRVLETQAGRGPLTELDFLLGSGSDRVGALAATTTLEAPAEPDSQERATLDDLTEAAERLETGSPLPERLELALIHGSSVGGARPKALVEASQRKWIAKFSSSTDRYPVMRVEHAAMELARRCGLEVPAVKRVQSLGRDVLLVERFDRRIHPNGWSRRFLVSALTVLRLHETEAQLASYLDVAGFVRRRARDPLSDGRALFRRMVFNILVGNTDDHARNHAFFWDGRQFALTPAYDICPDLRAGRMASQAMVVGSEGRHSTLRNALSEAGQFGLERPEARRTVEELVEAVRREWPAAAEHAQLSARLREQLERETILGPGCFE